MDRTTKVHKEMNHKMKQIYVFMLSNTKEGIITLCNGCDKLLPTKKWAKHLLETDCVGYKDKWWS